ncbi:hypothetical protein H5P36_25115 [Bacillus sp. APMAM]|nr:hypothetical protein [Bacillus sp. APMAM]
MVKRRTIIEDLHEEEQKLLVNVVEYKKQEEKEAKEEKEKKAIEVTKFKGGV